MLFLFLLLVVVTVVVTVLGRTLLLLCLALLLLLLLLPARDTMGPPPLRPRLQFRASLSMIFHFCRTYSEQTYIIH